ncbi:hypothetical protein JCM16303_007184 [Sporobolomyces ruberrimus]
MSLAYLPPELLRAIVIEMCRDDLASACRISKSFLGVALPVLYRDIGDSAGDQHGIPVTEVISTQEEEVREDEQEETEGTDSSDETETPSVVAPSQPPRATVWEALERHPEWSTHVRMVLLRLDTSTDEARTLRVLVSFPFLKQLEIFDSASSATFLGLCAFLAANCTRAVTTLRIALSGLSSGSVLSLLARLSLLESFTLYGGDSFRFDFSGLPTPETPLTLPHLRLLSLWKLPSNCALFATIAKACPTLAALSIDTHSLVTLDHQHLSTIRHLTIFGRLSRDEYSNEIVHVLDSCGSLKTFTLVVSIPPNGQNNIGPLETVQILRRLPHSLRRLTVISTLFTPAYLIDFLSSGSHKLRAIEFFRSAEDRNSGSTRVYNVAIQGKIEEVCAKRHIRATWHEEEF